MIRHLEVVKEVNRLFHNKLNETSKYHQNHLKDQAMKEMTKTNEFDLLESGTQTTIESAQMGVLTFQNFYLKSPRSLEKTQFFDGKSYHSS